MDVPTHLNIVNAAVKSGFTVLSKSASATPEQSEILSAAWPAEGENITKLASLSRVLATGLMVEEAEASAAQ